ncbi:GNAT family N-acetyltransferase, partial [Anaerorhabdus sp.]|uniref:GNAT family N-acetyltransferase n=2 Tax=Anaerorhabdus sp. TaxID=1872524 RepID=UPI002B21449B
TIMEFIFEKLGKEHKKEVVNILNYYIENTTAAYRAEIVDEEFSFRFLEGVDVYSSYVMKTTENKVIGFCILEPHKTISTFSEVAEVMYFVHNEYTGFGVGSLALSKMEEEARKIGVKKLLADISTENTKSINFHIKNGFVEYGRLCDVGNKFGRKFGIVYLVKNL